MPEFNIKNIKLGDFLNAFCSPCQSMYIKKGVERLYAGRFIDFYETQMEDCFENPYYVDFVVAENDRLYIYVRDCEKK